MTLIEKVELLCPVKVTVVVPPVGSNVEAPGRCEVAISVTVPLYGPENVIVPVAVVWLQGKLVTTIDVILTPCCTAAWLLLTAYPMAGITRVNNSRKTKNRLFNNLL